MNITRWVTLCLILISTTTTQAEDSIAIKARREIRIEGKIASLTQQLLKQEQELESLRLQSKRISPLSIASCDSISLPQAEASAIATTEAVETPDYTIEFKPRSIDSLLNIWIEAESNNYYNSFFEQYSFCPEERYEELHREANLPIDSLYKQRLLRLASPVELPYNSIVRGYINRYTSQNSKLMSYIITRSQYYFPSIEEELIKADLPVELRAMAVIESALNASALSRSGAAGLWQFMPSTGAMYGLEINSLVDERCDPHKATIAACRFMADLYKIYGDWGLAIAAYNCGAGNVNKAIARSGLKSGTYCDIYDFLPHETRGYLPAFIGASYGYAYHKEHDITPIEHSLPLATDTLNINRILHLGQISEVLDLPIDIIKKLNPQYRREIIPATTKSYSLRLPQYYVSAYIEQEEAIHALDKKYLKEYINPANIEKLRRTPHNRIHTVRNGDTLSGIASKYRVTTRQLMNWNNLKNANKLSIGQKLKVSN